MRNKRILVLVEVALATALSLVLGLWEFRLPFNVAGGSISLAMLPMVVIALRRGPVAGAITGAIYGSFDLIMGKAYILHWAQVLLDYPLPYLLFGLGVGLFVWAYRKSFDKSGLKKSSAILVAAVAVGGVLRWVAHVLSGAIFFASYAPEGMNPWIYSMGYNAGYILPTVIIVCLASLIVVPALQKALPAE
ncbi:MAG: energy-coupled thiamine transporter ThiT [Coriobacteriales bacterium]|nr:energy-coupled thiamine transporter ThiT [Coriobacteriales bacterium]MBQ6585778.1 energy-coupled thiamine transporter ThiT [Coriobacteriales bacterium]